MVDTTVRQFAEFINNSWYSTIFLLKDRTYASDEDSISDWLQVNWELLVERRLLGVKQYLEVYGEGADFYGSSSRITDHNFLPTHAIKLQLKNERTLDLLNDEEFNSDDMTFEKFVSFKDGFYHVEPDFKYVLLNDDSIERVVGIGDVEFKLQSLDLR